MILEVTDRATGRSRRGNKCLLAIAEVATNPGPYLPTSHQDPNADPCVNVVTIRNLKASRSSLPASLSLSLILECLKSKQPQLLQWSHKSSWRKIRLGIHLRHIDQCTSALEMCIGSALIAQKCDRHWKYGDAGSLQISGIPGLWHREHH